MVGKPSGSGRGVLLGDAEGVESFPHASLEASLWRYYAAVTSTNPVDVSTIEHDPSTGTPTAALVASHGPDGVAYFGAAATFEIAGDLTPRGSHRVGREIAEALVGRIRNADRGLAVRIVGHGTEITGFERVLLASGASATLNFWAETNLSLPKSSSGRVSGRATDRSLTPAGGSSRLRLLMKRDPIERNSRNFVPCIARSRDESLGLPRAGTSCMSC